MGERQAGLQRVAFRRVGTSGAASSSLTINQGWDPNAWYIPGAWGALGPGPAAGYVTLAFGGITSTDDTLVAVPQLFLQAGTITKVGVAYGNPLSTNNALSAIYRSKVGSLWQPGALATSVLWNAGSFNSVHTQTVSVSVTAGEILWFVRNAHNQASGGELNITPPNALPAILGSNWDGVTLPGTFRIGIGWKKASVFAYPPPDPFPAVTDTTDWLLTTSFSGVPTFPYQFQVT